MSDELLTSFAETLIADGRRDREVLRRRWNVPSWRAEIEQIANALERYPLLVPLVRKAIDDELSRLGNAVEPTQTIDTFETTEAASDADRQDETLPNVREEPAAQ